MSGSAQQCDNSGQSVQSGQIDSGAVACTCPDVAIYPPEETVLDWQYAGKEASKQLTVIAIWIVDTRQRCT